MSAARHKDPAMPQTASSRVTLVLGIPIDDLTPDQAVRRTLELADAYRADGRPRQIVTVNVDFLTNALGWTPWSPPRHPELLEILRRADLVTADGMPVVWLARLLGTPIERRVTGADLAPALASAMAQSGHRLYLLGGRGDIGQQAADRLVELNPGLRIAGVHSPFVHTEGEAMLEAEEQDADTVARINAAEPDVLLIAFGNPKQEIWFQRNRHRLKVGVGIGIGGTFEFIVGRVSRAPVWMQRTGLEWIYRIAQDPKRLWRRYAVGLAKLAVMSLPLVLHDRFQHWRFRRRLQHRPGVIDQTAPPDTDTNPPEDGARRLVLPEIVDANWVRSQQSAPDQDATDALVVDFSATRFLDSTALGYLARIWKTRQNTRRRVRAEGLEHTPVASLLKMTRTWDLFTERHDQPPPAPQGAARSQGAVLLEPERPIDGIGVARLSGRLDADRAARLDLDALGAELDGTDLLLDLSDLQFIDSTGLGLLFKLQRRFASQGRRLALCGMQPPVRQLMEVTRLTTLFLHARTRQEALALLAQPETDAMR